MSQQLSTIRKLMRTALAASVGVVLLMAGFGHALAQDDEDDELPDQKFFKSILTGLGLRKAGVGPDIEYRERSPLVVPPTRDLPPPESENARPLDPSFPVDQDVKRRKEAAAKRKREEKPFDWSDLGRQMRPDELRKGAGTPKDEALRRRSAETPEQFSQPMTPSALGFKGFVWDPIGFFSGNNQDEIGKFEGEPPRASLTDPPAGYRTPSPAQPYGLAKDHTKPKPLTQEERVTIGAGSR